MNCEVSLETFEKLCAEILFEFQGHTEKVLLALVLCPGLTTTSPLREIIRVYSQIPTHEWIKVKRKIDTPRYLALLDTKCFKNSKTERNNKPNKPLLHTTKALSL